MNKPPIRYAGGKSRAIKHILPFFPKDLKIVVSPFIGGGAIEVHLTNLDIRVNGFDIFRPLVIFWNELKWNKEQLVGYLKSIHPTEEDYKTIKEILISWEYTQEMLKDWKTDYYKRDNVIQLTSLEVAAYYFFNHNTSYGPGYLGWPSSVYMKQDKWDLMIKTLSEFDGSKLQVMEMDFTEVIPAYPNEFLYLDPPYYMGKDEDNKMFTPIYPMRNIPVHHTGFDHEALRDLLYNHKGKFVMSYNNCQTIREWYKDFRLEYPKWNYSMGNGETRIGENRIKDGNLNSKDSHEILIIKE